MIQALLDTCLHGEVIGIFTGAQVCKMVDQLPSSAIARVLAFAFKTDGPCSNAVEVPKKRRCAAPDRLQASGSGKAARSLRQDLREVRCDSIEM